MRLENKLDKMGRVARHVQTLTAPETGCLFGYKLAGARPGPSILVAGHESVAAKLFERLLSLPTIPWLRGNIYLIVVEAFDAAAGWQQVTLAPKDHLDELLFLPFAADNGHAEEAATAAYWAVLRLCARLGMIDGRGVSSSSRQARNGR